VAHLCGVFCVAGWCFFALELAVFSFLDWKGVVVHNVVYDVFLLSVLMFL
jgi:hypothetical protein